MRVGFADRAAGMFEPKNATERRAGVDDAVAVAMLSPAVNEHSVA